MSEIPVAFGEEWQDFKETLTALSRAFGSFARLDRFRDKCIMQNPSVAEDCWAAFL